MLKKTSTLILSTSLVLACSSTLALNKGFYLGAEAGYSHMDLGSELSAYESNADNVGVALLFGYNFQITNKTLLGLELSGRYLGYFKPLKVNLYAPSLSVTGTIALSHKLDVYGKVGVTREMVYYDDVSAHSDLAPIAALGLAYNLTSNWDINLEYTRIFGKSLTEDIITDSNKAITYDTVMIGFTYHFGN